VFIYATGVDNLYTFRKMLPVKGFGVLYFLGVYLFNTSVLDLSLFETH